MTETLIIEVNVPLMKGDTVSMVPVPERDPNFDSLVEEQKWTVDANVNIGGGPDAFGYKRLAWETKQESRGNTNRYLFNLGIWVGMALLTLGMIMVGVTASAKESHHTIGFMALGILVNLLILCVVVLFRKNNRSIANALSHPQNRWVLLNYLLFAIPWIVFPWLFDDGDTFAIAAILWFTSGPVFVLNSSGQMWFRYQSYIGKSVRSGLKFRNAFFLLLVNLIYISPFIILSNQFTSDVGGTVCCIALIAVIVYGFGYIYFAFLYHELVGKMGLEGHFFFGGEKGLMAVVPVIHIIGSVLLVVIILMAGGGG